MSERPSGSPEARAYPRDEFDDVTAGEGRRGAHRARPNPALAMLPLLLVVVLVVAVVVGAITVLDGAEPEAAPAVSAAPTAAPSPQTTGGSTAPATPAPTAPTAAPTTSATPPATSPAAVVDPDAPLTVLNGTRTTGLATGATEVLQEQGWTVLEAGNYREGDTPPTTVFYPSEALAATAEAVAEDLGGAATELSDAFGSEGLTVVLGEDYQP